MQTIADDNDDDDDRNLTLFLDKEEDENTRSGFNWELFGRNRILLRTFLICTSFALEVDEIPHKITL